MTDATNKSIPLNLVDAGSLAPGAKQIARRLVGKADLPLPHDQRGGFEMFEQGSVCGGHRQASYRAARRRRKLRPATRTTQRPRGRIRRHTV